MSKISDFKNGVAVMIQTRDSVTAALVRHSDDERLMHRGIGRAVLDWNADVPRFVVAYGSIVMPLPVLSGSQLEGLERCLGRMLEKAGSLRVVTSRHDATFTCRPATAPAEEKPSDCIGEKMQCVRNTYEGTTIRRSL